MTETPLAEIFAQYLPHLLVAHAERRPGPPTAPYSEQIPAAVLFADISGFSALSEHLAQRGPGGVEDLTRILNDYFGRLIAVIEESGGDIVKFAGDALLVLWPAASEAGLEQAVHRAAYCALQAQTSVAAYRAVDEQTLSMRMALGVGNVTIGHVGGERERWEFFVTGRPMLQVKAADALAEPGAVVLSAAAWALCRLYAEAQALQQGAVRLQQVEPPPPSPRRRHQLNTAVQETLRHYLPGAILHRLQAGHRGGWLGELRRLTILFVNLPELDYRTPLDLAQRIMRSLQQVLYRFEGSLNKLSVDDKGVVLVGALGLPPLAHEDDPLRGVKTALAMHKALTDLKLRSSIGVTTGRVYCGVVGSRLRREYTMVGTVVNLSARLMQNADGDVLCDEATYRATCKEIDYTVFTLLRVKGKKRALAVHRPLGVKRRVSPQSLRTDLIGREHECKVLRTRLETLLSDGSGGTVVLEGAAGSGSSSLLDNLSAEARLRGQRVYFSAADAMESTTPYFAWQNLFTQMLEIDGVSELGERRARVTQVLASEHGLLELCPLLNGVLPLQLSDTRLTAQMPEEVRAVNGERLLLRLLQIMQARGPLLILLDDAHWLDSASWSLLLQAVRQLPQLLLVLAVRSDECKQISDYRRLLELPQIEQIVLAPLTAEQTLAAAAGSLGVAALPDALIELIGERAEGRPLFALELALALRDAGILQIDSHGARLTVPPARLPVFELPNSIESAVTARIDRLTPAQQLALKVASVIGRTFPLAAVQAIFPIAHEREQLPAHLEALSGLGVILSDALEEIHYHFRNQVVREVAYGLVPAEMRAKLHRKTAQWYERKHAGELAPYYALLAQHWSRAFATEPALHYLEQAAEQALGSHASREAAALLEQALQLADAEPTALAASRRARWERMYGQAEWLSGHPHSARQHLEKALALLERPVPTGRWQVAYGLLTQAYRQLRRRFPARRIPEVDPEVRQRCLEAAQACEGLAFIYYFAADLERFFHIALSAANLAEQSGGMPPVLARAYTTLSLACGGLPWHGLAQHYRRRALQAALQVDQLATWSWYYLIVGTYQAGCGRYNGALAKLRRGLRLAERLGDQRRQHELLASLGTVAGSRGRLAESAGYFHRLEAIAADQDDIQARIWGVLGEASGLYLRSDWRLLTKRLSEAQILLQRYPERCDVLGQLDFYAFSAKHALRAHRLVEAAEFLAKGLVLVRRLGRPTQYHTLTAITHLLETALILCWRYRATAQAGEHRRQARFLLRHLRDFARIFPIGRAQYWYSRGQYAAIIGRRRAAIRAWRKARTIAEQIKASWVEVRACHALAAQLGPDHPEHGSLLHRADHLLQELEGSTTSENLVFA